MTLPPRISSARARAGGDQADEGTVTDGSGHSARIHLGRVFTAESANYFLLLGTTLFLVAFGLVMVLSSSSVDSYLADMGFFGGILRQAEDRHLESLRTVVSGAEKCPEQVYATLARRWPGTVVLEGYGITECSPVVSVNREDDPRPGSIGRPLRSLEWAIVDLEQGRRVEPGQAGMLLVRGPSIFSGYLNPEVESPFETFEGLSWYRTGDLVRQDRGVLVFAGRLKRFVKLGGEMVSLPAIEEVLAHRFQGDEETEPFLAVEASEAELNPDLILFSVSGILRDEANAAIRAAGLSALHSIRVVRQVEQIPTLGTGKTDYRALRALLTAPTA